MKKNMDGMFGLNQEQVQQKLETTLSAKGEQLFRHGDLLFMRLSEEEADKVAKKALAVKGNIVAYGEATGHNHKCVTGRVQLLTTESATAEPTHLLVEQETQLVHEEHKPINIDEGTFAIVREQEFDSFRNMINRVQD